jgi:sporulation protein YlmC with PRC-barrel domain
MDERGEAIMREGSYMEIKPGMRVVGADGEGVGSVSQVLADQASGIFHGLAVRHGLFGDTRLVPGDQVEAVHEGVVEISSRWDELEEYVSVQEQMAERRQGYA